MGGLCPGAPDGLRGARGVPQGSVLGPLMGGLCPGAPDGLRGARGVSQGSVLGPLMGCEVLVASHRALSWGP
ncbi:hypothetical protein EYF80_055744 [Liparis tanakae]|uniref:Uncharacterized protein n=1 Tax=Liparis tanakae TaxID=230148 RepID=A0A4Z2EZ99_9TELE|nr:hypothetical protein EYF80_055744 [Liparis tanakae]